MLVWDSAGNVLWADLGLEHLLPRAKKKENEMYRFKSVPEEIDFPRIIREAQEDGEKLAIMIVGEKNGVLLLNRKKLAKLPPRVVRCETTGSDWGIGGILHPVLADFVEDWNFAQTGTGPIGELGFGAYVFDLKLEEETVAAVEGLMELSRPKVETKVRVWGSRG